MVVGENILSPADIRTLNRPARSAVVNTDCAVVQYKEFL